MHLGAKSFTQKTEAYLFSQVIRTSRHWGPHCRREGFLGHFSRERLGIWEHSNFSVRWLLKFDGWNHVGTTNLNHYRHVWFLWHNWLISGTRKKASFRKKWALESFQMLLICQMMLSFQAKPWPTKIGSQAVSGSFSAWHAIIARLVVELLNSWVGWDKLPGIPGGKYSFFFRQKNAVLHDKSFILASYQMIIMWYSHLFCLENRHDHCFKKYATMISD